MPMTAEQLIERLKKAKTAVRKDPRKMPPGDAQNWTKVLLKKVGDRIQEHTQDLRGEIRDMQERLKDIDDAWDRWDFDDLYDMDMISNDERDFVEAALDLYPQ